MSKRFDIHNWQAKQILAEDEDKSLQISQEEMEELHKNGKVRLKDGSILAFIKEDELDEMSTTASAPGYSTPFAFKKKKKKVNEVSYGDFKRNTESSPRKK